MNKEISGTESKEILQKELKQVELEVLRAFVNVCEELGLRYYLLGGTLLGAVRHQGFIPWDDDIDVGMPREDFEVFLQKGQDILPEHLLVQSLHSEPEYPNCFAKIRNSNTTFIETSTKKLNINHGIYIDIFPLDYYPERAKEQRRFDRKNRLYTRRISMIFNVVHKKTLKSSLVSLLVRLRYPSVRKSVQKCDKLYRSVPQSGLIANYGGAWGKKEIVPATWYGEGALLNFEGIKACAPAKYHEWLTQVYGDYMQLPPEEKRVSHHFTDVIDPHKPYTEYLRR